MNTAMNLLRVFSIRLRMLGAIGMVLGMFGLIAAVALINGVKVRDLTDGFVSGTMAQAGSSGQALEHLAQLRALQKQAVIDAEEPAALAQTIQAWGAQLAAAKGAAGRLPGAGDAVARLDAYARAAEPALKALKAGDNPRALDRTFDRAQEDLAAAAQAFGAQHKASLAAAQGTHAEVQRTLDNTLIAFSVLFAVVLLVFAPLTQLNSVSITRPIIYAQGVARAIAGGDLSCKIVVEGGDECSTLLADLSRMQDSLRRMVGEVHESSQSIQLSSTEVASGNTDLSSRTEQTAASLQQTASSMEQLTGNVRQSADSAAQANQLAVSAADVARRGGAVVAQVVTTMDEINHSSKKIADIIGTIDGIAFQTNILALNAAVEAARAGEQGRGFAVVAAEVRSLAQRSAEAAREIKGLIGASVDRVEAGSKLVADAGSTMEEIVTSVQRVTDIISEISAAAAEQSTGIGQVNSAVTHLDSMTQQNAALVEESAAAAASLRDQAVRLAELVGHFRLQAA